MDGQDEYLTPAKMPKCRRGSRSHLYDYTVHENYDWIIVAITEKFHYERYIPMRAPNNIATTY